MKCWNRNQKQNVMITFNTCMSERGNSGFLIINKKKKQINIPVLFPLVTEENLFLLYFSLNRV